MNRLSQEGLLDVINQKQDIVPSYREGVEPGIEEEEYSLRESNSFDDSISNRQETEKAEPLLGSPPVNTLIEQANEDDVQEKNPDSYSIGNGSDSFSQDRMHAKDISRKNTYGLSRLGSTNVADENVDEFIPKESRVSKKLS